MFGEAFKWISNHYVTVLFCVLYTLASLVYNIFFIGNEIAYGASKQKKSAFPWNIIAGDLETVPFTVIFAILLSGVEASIGSTAYFMELLFCIPFILLFRHFFIPVPTGATYLVYVPFFTFILNHKPYYYFKIKSFEFTDTLFYCIMFIEYVLFNPIMHSIDLLPTLIALFLWKLVVLIGKSCTKGRNEEMQRI